MRQDDKRQTAAAVCEKKTRSRGPDVFKDE
jgi:hypothetical protein